MCVAFFEWSEDGFVVIHNRDERLDRETQSTHWWNKKDDIHILAPKDLISGGMWFGYEQSTRRVAFLTNLDADEEKRTSSYESSRGELVANFLQEKGSALSFIQQLNSNGREYAPYNLILFSGTELVYHSNRISNSPVSLTMGSYGLSNMATLYHPVSKVSNGLKQFQTLRKTPAPADLQGLLDFMHSSSILVKLYSLNSTLYGTRSTIRLVLKKDCGVLIENYMDPKSKQWSRDIEYPL